MLRCVEADRAYCGLYFLCLLALCSITGATNEGKIEFLRSKVYVHENQKSVLLTLTRTCHESLNGFCSGSVSIGYSTEQKADSVLPANISVRQGSSRAWLSGDVREYLGRGEMFRIADANRRNHEELDNVYFVSSSFARPFNSTYFELDRDFEGSNVYASVGKIRVRLPGDYTHHALPGTNYISTSVDLRNYISRGDPIRIGAESFQVSDDLDRNFSATYLPLDKTFHAHAPEGVDAPGFTCRQPLLRTYTWRCCLFTNREFTGLTTRGELGKRIVVNVHAEHGNKKVVTSTDVAGEIAAGDFLKIGEITHIIDSVDNDGAYGKHILSLRTAFNHPTCKSVNCKYAGKAMKETVAIQLPGSVCAFENSHVVTTTHDFQDLLSIGDFVKVGNHLATVRGLNNYSESGDAINAHQIIIDPVYGLESSCNLTAKTNSRYTPLNGRVSVQHESPVLHTTRSLKTEIYRGERIKIGIRNYLVSSSSSKFNDFVLPLEAAFDGYERHDLKLYRALPNSATTASNMLDYLPAAGRVMFDHGQSQSVIQIEVKNDEVAEFNEILRVSLFDPRFENLLSYRNGQTVFGPGELQPVYESGGGANVSTGTNASAGTIDNTQTNVVRFAVSLAGENNATQDLRTGDHVQVGRFNGVVAGFFGSELNVSFASNTSKQLNDNQSLRKLVPSLGQRVYLDVIIQNDNQNIVRGRLPGTITYNKNDNKIQSTIDLRTFVQIGDFLVLNDSQENLTAIEINGVGVDGLEPSKSIVNYTASDIFLGSQPDSPGAVYFSKTDFTVVESAEGEASDSKMVELDTLFSCTSGLFYIKAQKALGFQISRGAEIFIDSDNYTCVGSNGSHVEITPAYKGATGQNKKVYRSYNKGVGYVTVSRTGSFSGTVEITITTCDGFQDSTKCTQQNKRNRARSSRVHSFESIFLPGYIKKSAHGTTLVERSSKVPWNLYAGDVIQLNGHVYTVCQSYGSNECVLNETHFSLAEVSDHSVPKSFEGNWSHGADLYHIQKLTSMLPGEIFVPPGPTSNAYFTSELRGLVDTRDPIKIGKTVLSNFTVSDHSPLGVLQGALNALPESSHVTTSVDQRPGFVQTIKCYANDGFFKVKLQGVWTERLPWNISTSNFLDALMKLPAVVDARLLQVTSKNTTLCSDNHAAAKFFSVHFLKVSFEHHEVFPAMVVRTEYLQYDGTDGRGTVDIDMPVHLQRSDFFMIGNDSGSWNQVFQVHPTQTYNATHIPVVKAISVGCKDCKATRVGQIALQSDEIFHVNVTFQASVCINSHCNETTNSQTTTKGYLFSPTSILDAKATGFDLDSKLLIVSKEARPGFVQKIRCVADGGTFRLGLGQEITRPIPFNASKQLFKKIIEELSELVNVSVVFLQNRSTICSPTLISPSLSNVSYASTVIEINVAKSSAETVDKFQVIEAEQLSLTSFESVILEIDSEGGLKRGDVILINNFMTKVSLGGEITKTKVPIDNIPEGAYLNHNIRKFRPSTMGKSADYMSLVNTHSIKLEHGVGSKTFPVQINADDSEESTEVISLVIEKASGLCSTMPCVYIQTLFCAASSGYFQLIFNHSYTPNISVNTTTNNLERILQEFDGIKSVTMWNTDPDNNICSASVVKNVITFQLDADKLKHVPVLLIDKEGITGPHNIYVKVTSPSPGDSNNGLNPSLLEEREKTNLYIIDDGDAGGIFSFVSDNLEVREDALTAFLEVTREHGSGGAVLVSYECTGLSGVSSGTVSNPQSGDYLCFLGPLAFAEGQLNAQIAVDIMDDTSFKGNATFRVDLTYALGVNASIHHVKKSCTVKIIDNDPFGKVGFLSPTFYALETGKHIVVVITRFGSLSKTLTLNISVNGDKNTSNQTYIEAVPGKDFVNELESVQIGEGQSTVYHPLRIIHQDVNFEVPRRARITITHAYENVTDIEIYPSTAFIQINNSDENPAPSIGFVTNQIRVFEDIVEAELVMRVFGQLKGAVSLSVFTEEVTDATISHASATACKKQYRGLCKGNRWDYQYQNLTVNIEPGVHQRSVLIPINNDIHYEADTEIFKVRMKLLSGDINIGSKSLGDGQQLFDSVNVTVLDDVDKPGFFQFSVESMRVNEDTKMSIVTVERIGGLSGRVDVSYSSCDSNINHNTPRKIASACQGHSTTATSGKIHHKSADYQSVSGTLKFFEGVSKMTFNVPIFDDLCKDPETIELRLIEAVANHTGALCKDKDPKSCVGIIKNKSRVLINLEDNNDPPDSHVSSIALIKDPSFVSTSRAILKLNSSVVLPFNFTLSVSDSLSTVYLKVMNNNVTKSSLQKALELCSLISGKININVLGAKEWAIEFDAAQPQMFQILLHHIQPSELQATETVIVTNVKPVMSYTMTNVPFLNQPQVEIRNYCNQKVVGASATVTAQLKTTFLSSCIQNDVNKKVEKQVISLRPYLKLGGNVKVLKGLNGVLYSSDPTSFVHDNYIFTRSSRSVIEQIMLGPATSEGNGIRFKIPGKGTLHSGTAVILVSNCENLLEKVVPGDGVMMGKGTTVRALHVTESSIQIAAIYRGPTLNDVSLFREANTYKITGTSLKLPGKFGAKLNSTIVYCSENLVEPRILEADDVIKIYEYTYTVKSVQYESDSFWTKIELTTVFSTGLCNKDSCKTPDWSAVDGYLIKGYKGQYWPISFDSVVESNNETFSLYRPTELGEAKATSGSNVLQSSSSKPFQIAKKGMKILVKFNTYVIQNISDDNKTLTIDQPFKGLTSNTVNVYTSEGLSGDTIIVGSYTISLPNDDSSCEVQYGASASSVKRCLLKLLKGHPRVRVAKSLHYGGLKYTITISDLAESLHQFQLNSTNIQGQIVTKVKRVTEGGGGRFLEANPEGVINLPLPSTRCGNLLGSTTVQIVNGTASFEDLVLGGSASSRFIRFSTNFKGDFTGPYKDFLPPAGGLFTDSGLLAAFEEKVQRLEIHDEPRWAIAGGAFGNPPVIHLMDSITNGQRVFNDNTTKVVARLKLNQDGLGNGRLISLAKDATRLPFTISITKNSSVGIITNLATGAYNFEDGKMLIINDGTQNYTHQIVSRAAASLVACTCVENGPNKCEYKDSRLKTSRREVQILTLDTGLNETVDGANDTATMHLRFAGLDLGRFGFGLGTVGRTCGKLELFPVKKEPTDAKTASCGNILKEAIENALPTLRDSVNLYASGIDAEVIVEDIIEHKSWRITISSIRKTSFNGQVIGNLDPIEIVTDSIACCCSAIECKRDVNGTVETVMDANGNIMPSEVQAIYAFADANVAELGGNFTISYQGHQSDVQIFPTTPASSKAPTLTPDNSMQKTIERLPGINPPVHVAIAKISSVGTLWIIEFRGNSGNVDQLEISAKTTCRLVTNEANEPNNFNTVSGSRGETIVTVDDSKNDGKLYDYWAGNNNFVGQRIQFGSYDSSYDIYTVVKYTEAEKEIELDKPLIVDLTKQQILWCPKNPKSDTAGNNTYVFATTVRQGETAITIDPIFSGQSGENLVVYDPERVVRTAKNGAVEFDDIAIVPMYKDMSRLNFREDKSFLNSFRSPLYSLQFSVLGSPGTTNASSNYFTVMSDKVLNLKIFTSLDGAKVDGQADPTTYGPGVVVYSPESNTFADENKQSEARALKIYVGTEESVDNRDQFLSSAGYHSVASIHLIAEEPDNSADIYGFTKRQFNKFCDPCKPFEKNWCTQRALAAVFDDVQISKPGKFRLRIFSSYEHITEQALVYTIQCNKYNMSQSVDVYFDNKLAVQLSPETLVTSFKKALEINDGIDGVAVLSNGRETVCGNTNDDSIAHIIILKWSLPKYNPMSMDVAKITVSDSTYVRVGNLWSDLDVDVKESGKTSAFNGDKLRPYVIPQALAGRTMVSGSARAIQFISRPKVVSASKLFQVDAGIFDSTSKLSVHPSQEDSCKNYAAKCSQPTDPSPPPAHVLECDYFFKCGDTDLPRKFRLEYWSPATTKRLCGLINVTQNSSLVITDIDMTAQLSAGQNLLIYDSTYSFTTSYYVKSLKTSEITLDRNYDEVNLPDGKSRKVIVYSRVSAASTNLDRRFVEESTNMTHSFVHFGNLSVKQSIPGLRIQVNEMTCFKIKNVTGISNNSAYQPSVFDEDPEGKDAFWADTHFIEVTHHSAHDVVSGNISAFYPIEKPDKSLLVKPRHSLKPGDRIYFPKLKKTLTMLKKLEAKSADVQQYLNKQKQKQYFTVIETDVLNELIGNSEDAACVQFDPLFTITLKAETNSILSGGYFTFTVENYGTTEETSLIYYSSSSLAEFLQNVESALEALANVDDVAVKSASEENDYKSSETKFFVSFLGVRSNIALKIKLRYVEQGPVLSTVPQHDGYKIEGEYDDGLYSSKPFELSVSSAPSSVKIIFEAAGANANHNFFVPLVSQLVDSRGTVVTGTNSTFSVFTLNNQRVQTIFCSANAGTFKLKISHPGLSSDILTNSISYDSNATFVQNSLRGIYVRVATATAAIKSEVLGNVNYFNNKYIYRNDVILISKGTCSDGSGIPYTVLKVTPDITLQHTVNVTGTINICKNLFPSARVSLGGTQTNICSSGHNPEPLKIQFQQFSSVFMDKYPALEVAENELVGENGIYQTLFCSAASGAFRLKFRGRLTKTFYANATVKDIKVGLEKLTTIGKVIFEPSMAASSICSSRNFTMELRNTPVLQSDGLGKSMFNKYVPTILIDKLTADGKIQIFHTNNSDSISINHGNTGAIIDGSNVISTNGTHKFEFLQVDRPGYYSLRIMEQSTESLKQNIICRADGGSFYLQFNGGITQQISFQANAATLESRIEELSTIVDVDVEFSDGNTVCTFASKPENIVTITYNKVKLYGTTTNSKHISFFPTITVPRSSLYTCDKNNNDTGILIIENFYADTSTPVFVSAGRISKLDLKFALPNSSETSATEFVVQPVVRAVDKLGNLVASANDIVRVGIIEKKRIQMFRCDGSAGFFRLSIYQEQTPNIYANATESDVETALKMLSRIDNAKVYLLNSSTGGSASRVCYAGGRSEILIDVHTVDCLKNESNSSLANFCSRKSVFIPDIKVKATHLTGGRGEVISTVVDHSILTGTLSVPLVNGLGLFHDLSVKLHFYNVSLVFFLLGRPFIRPVVSEPFNIFVGRFSFIQFLDTLPSNMTNNYSTSITVELVDKGKNRVISENQHLIRTDIENPKNNASSAVATIDSLSVHGVAAFRVNASFTLSIIRLRIKAPNVQSIPLLYSDNIAIISMPVTIKATRKTGSLLLSKIVEVDAESRFLSSLDTPPLFNYLERGDSFVLSASALPSSYANNYFVHKGNYFDSSSIPLERPYEGNSTKNISLYKVTIGGEPVPSQPKVEVLDSSGNKVGLDSSHFVTALLNPTVNATKSACGGSVMQGNNRIQILSCTGSDSSDGFTITFLGEVSPIIRPDTNASELLKKIMKFSMVKDAQVEIIKKNEENFLPDDYITLERSATACSTNGSTAMVVYLNEIDGYLIEESLPLMKLSTEWAKVVNCNYNKINESGISSFSLSYNGQSSRSIGVYSGPEEVKNTLEQLEEIDEVDVFYSSGESFCNNAENNTVFIALRRVKSISYNDRSNIEIGYLSDQFMEITPVAFDTYAEESGLSVRSLEFHSVNSYFPKFQTGGSHTVRVNNGEADFDTILGRISIDKACEIVQYQILLFLNKDKVSNAINILAGDTFYVYPGSPRALKFIQQPKISKRAGSQAYFLSYRVAVVDRGGNIAEKFSGCLLNTSLNEAEAVQNKRGDTALERRSVSSMDGIVSFDEVVLNSSSAGRLYSVDSAVVRRQELFSPDRDQFNKFFSSGSCSTYFDLYASSDPFYVIGAPEYALVKQQPPRIAKSGVTFSVTIDVLDHNNRKLLNLSSTVAASLALNYEDNVRCPLYCADLKASSTHASNIHIKDGTVSFSSVVIDLPMGTPNENIKPIYSPEIQLISLSNAKSGSFRLKVSLDPIFPALSETYVTQNINWNAAAMAAQENSTSNEPGIGSGESMQSKLQAIPGIGTVHIQRRDLINSRGSQTVRQWYVTYLSFIGDISALILDKTSKLPSNSSVSQRTINDGVAYSLTIGLDFGNGKKSELKTRDFKLEP